MAFLRSKVWPALVRSSLNLEPAGEPLQGAHFAYRPRRRRPPSLGAARRLASQLGRQLACSRSAWSDTFCVAGAITAIIGSLVASFGIFPKNQARIRLYLECVGCAMVVVGVLIVFLSQKMRPRLQHQLHLQAEQDHELSLDQPRSLGGQLTGGKMAAFHQRKFDTFQLESASSGFDLVAIGPANCWEQVQRERRQSGRKSLEAASSDLKLQAELAPSSWIPAPDSDLLYGQGHQAALEAALSLVLTAATLVGYRSVVQTDGQHHCCLHHQVQHKLKARRWLARFRQSPSRSFGGGARSPNDSALAAESTLVVVAATTTAGSNHQPAI